MWPSLCGESSIATEQQRSCGSSAWSPLFLDTRDNLWPATDHPVVVAAGRCSLLGAECPPPGGPAWLKNNTVDNIAQNPGLRTSGLSPASSILTVVIFACVRGQVLRSLGRFHLVVTTSSPSAGPFCGSKIATICSAHPTLSLNFCMCMSLVR